MIRHIVRRGVQGSPPVFEKWLDDMANEHRWELVTIIPPNPHHPSSESSFVFRREEADA